MEREIQWNEVMNLEVDVICHMVEDGYVFVAMQEK